MCPQSEREPAAVASEAPEFSPEEREFLLKVAHESLSAALKGTSFDRKPPSSHLTEKRAVFTTLRNHGQLRGCIGHVFPVLPLWQAVSETACAAAFDDPRFASVSADELPEISIEISVLSRLRPILPGDVVPGKHGLLVSRGERRGLLLPQVPVEWGWDREAFLSQTCLKAGLPPDCWAQGVDLQAFTAEVFGDPESTGTLPRTI